MTNQNWDLVLDYFKEKFGGGEILDLDAILFIIGVRELGMGKITLKKDEKLYAIHIAVCRLLEPYGYYIYEGKDREGWPHYRLVEQLPELKANEQQILMKKAILQYFEDEDLWNS